MITMKHHFLYVGLMAALMVSCTVKEAIDLEDDNLVLSAEETFYAYTEANSDDTETKTYVDAANSHVLRWNKDDRITIFNRKAVGNEYAFTGEDGSAEGAFAKIEGGDTPAQGEASVLSATYAIYPHSGETTIQTDGTISFNLPATQNYQRDDSFGKDANVMVAKTDNNVLLFKNAGGYLTLRLYGNRSMSISSITLEGKNNEPLAGPCTISMSGEDGLPALTMAGGDDVSKQIRLFCKDVVELSTSSDNCKEFWFVLPPMTFTKGLKITVATSDGGVFTKETSNAVTIERNKYKRMAPLQVSASSSNRPRINSISTIVGKTADGADKTYTATLDENTLTYTLTLPTVTDFSHTVLTYSISSGAVLKADDVALVSGVTAFDASAPVALAVCSGDKERRYSLIVRNTGLPVVRITTEGFTQADVESQRKYKQNGVWIDERKWWPTDMTETVPEGSATFHIDNADGTVDLDHAPMAIKGRGNATWKYNKRPFAIKLLTEEKVKVLGMKKSKRWILLANWKDRTLLRNDAAFWLSQKTELTLKKTDDNGNTIKEKVGFPYSVHGQFVELVFNDVHRGNYYLCEQVRIEKNRVDLKEMAKNETGETDPLLLTGGYMMEIDNNFDEKFKFESDGFGLKYMFKDPDDDLSTQSVNYMTDYINNLEEMILDIPNGNYQYRDYLDMDSAIWFMFINELTGNGDFFNNDGNSTSEWYGPHSTYFYKDRDVRNEDESITESKLFMGPVWDFDYLTFYDKNGTRSSKWVGVAESGYYYYYFTQDPVFRARTKELWRAYKLEIQSLMLTYIDNMKTKLSISEPINTAMWGYSNTSQDQNQNGDNTDSFETAVTKMKAAFTKKLNFMDEKIEADDYRN